MGVKRPGGRVVRQRLAASPWRDGGTDCGPGQPGRPAARADSSDKEMDNWTGLTVSLAELVSRRRGDGQGGR